MRKFPVAFRYVLLVILSGIASPVLADDDDASSRPFSADRPGKANGPFTVEQGRFDIETDFVNVIDDHWAATPTTTRVVTVGDPLLKWGVGPDTDIELQLGGYQHVTVKNRATGQTTKTDGYGDETLRLKQNLAGNDGSVFGIALLPYLKLPIASESLRAGSVTNNQIEGGVIVPMGYNLPDDWVLGYETELDALKNADNGGAHANFVNIGYVSHPLFTKDLTATMEFYSSVSARKTSPDFYTLDPSLAYQVTPDLAFDVELDIGLNREAPDTEMICGVSWVY